MGAKEINNGVDTLSADQLQAAADISAMEVGDLPANHEEASKWLTLKAEKLSKIKTGDLGMESKKNIEDKIRQSAGLSSVNKPGTDAVLGAISGGKSTDKNNSVKENTDLDNNIASWESSIDKSNKALSEQQAEAFKNIDSLEKKDRDLIVTMIDDLEDQIEAYNREYADENNFDKVIKKDGEDVDYYDYLETEINNETQKLSKIREKYTQLFEEGLTLTDNEKQDVRGMNASEFIRKYSREERLKFVTFSGEKGNVGNVDSLTFTFSYDGVFNRELYTKLTAGQVLPKNVNSVKYQNTDYIRSSLLGEFFNAEGKRLKIGEGTNITDIQYRNDKEISAYEYGLERDLAGLPNNLKDNVIAQEAVKRGIEPQLFIDIVGPAIDSVTDKDYKRALLEEELTSFERFKGNYGVGSDEITLESVKTNYSHKKVIAALFNQVNGKEQGWYGEQEFAKKNGYESVHSQSLQLLEQKYGINAEVLGETTLGKRIVDHLKKRNYRPYEGQAYNCGKNVGEALRAIGIVGQGIPRGGRDGKKWGGFMEQRPDFVKSNIEAHNAPAGAVISYQPVAGKGSGPRQEYGHVEIALGNGKYWFGATASNPGGSYRNPPKGTYEVFVPKGSPVESTTVTKDSPKEHPKNGIEFLNNLENIKGTETYDKVTDLMKNTKQKLGNGDVDMIKLYKEMSKEWFGLLKNLSKKDKNYKDIAKMLTVSSDDKEEFNTFMKELKDGTMTESDFDKKFKEINKIDTNVKEDSYKVANYEKQYGKNVLTSHI